MIRELLFGVFAVQILIFIGLLVNFVFRVKRFTREGFRARIFLNVDPVIKTFYLLFLGTTLSYFMILLYFLSEKFYELFVLGEITLGMSIIGLAYLISYLVRREKIEKV